MGRNCVSKIQQNIIISIVTKLIVFGFAIAGYAYLWLAILTDVGTMLLVTLNSMTLLTRRMTVDECDRTDLNEAGVLNATSKHLKINFANEKYLESSETTPLLAGKQKQNYV